MSETCCLWLIGLIWFAILLRMASKNPNDTR